MIHQNINISNSTIISSITSRFPRHKLIIEELFGESDSFREICHDYFEVSRILDELKASNIEQETIMIEYDLLAQELQKELLKKISMK